MIARRSIVRGLCACLLLAGLVCSMGGCADDSQSQRVWKYFALGVPFEVIVAPPPAAKVKAMGLKAKYDTWLTTAGAAQIRCHGTFLAQVTIAFNSAKGLTPGQSMGVLEFRQMAYGVNGRRLFVGCRYETNPNGVTAIVVDSLGGQHGTTAFCADAFQLDVRIEQTDTQLIFSARPTADAGAPAAEWTMLATFDTPADPAPFGLHFGMRDVKKGGTFFFRNLYFDPEQVGEDPEASIVDHIRDMIDACRAAKGAISATPQDLAAAIAHVNDALNANDAALAEANAALAAATFANVDGGKRCIKILAKRDKALIAIRTVLATPGVRASKVNAQLAKLDNEIGQELAAAANVFGPKVSNLKTYLGLILFDEPD